MSDGYTFYVMGSFLCMQITCINYFDFVLNIVYIEVIVYLKTVNVETSDGICGERCLYLILQHILPLTQYFCHCKL